MLSSAATPVAATPYIKIIFWGFFLYLIVTVDRQEREGMTRSYGPQVRFKPGPLQRTQKTRCMVLLGELEGAPVKYLLDLSMAVH